MPALAAPSRTTPPIAGERMGAIVQRAYGTADVLSIGEVDRPAIAAGEVLVEIRAAGLDRGTWHLMAGLPLEVRLVSGLRAPKVAVTGYDVAGVVDGGRRRRHALCAGRRGLRHRQGLVRRAVRRRARTSSP